MHSSSRNGAKVIWLAVHTTEGIMRATDLRDWTSWAGSSHAASDETGALLTPADGFVPYDRAAWTLRNGNSISENIEQCGWARWTRAEWLARPKLLDATARWLADRSKARGIPLVKLSPAEVAARKPGVLGHGDYSTGTGDGSHWDPGPGYPWDVVLDKATAYRSGVANTPAASEEDDMARLITTDRDDRVLYVDHDSHSYYHVKSPDVVKWLKNQGVQELPGKQPFNMLADYVNRDAPVAAASVPVAAGSTGSLSDADLERIAKAVADEQARRQAA